MKLAAVFVMCACGAPAPAKEPRPDLAGPRPEPSPFPEFPAIAPPPVSHPVGAPLAMPVSMPTVGDAEREVIASTFEQHYVAATTTRYQRTERNFELRVRVLAVEADHPSTIEVTADLATETVALGSSPDTASSQVETLLAGSYVVMPGRGDEMTVTRAGRPIQGREQEELANLFEGTLRGAASAERFLESTPLPVGEAIVLDDEQKHALAGADPLPGTFTLSLPTATTTTTTARYQLDVDSKGPMPGGGTFELRTQRTMTFDRATGRQLEQRDLTHKIERYGASMNDTFRTSTYSMRPAAK